MDLCFVLQHVLKCVHDSVTVGYWLITLNTMSPHPPYQIYSDCMAVAGMGLPLWKPEPSKHGDILIGDVGFVSEGMFHRLFSATHAKDHEINKRGVPDDFIPLDDSKIEEDIRYRLDHFLPPGPLCATSVSSLGFSVGVNESTTYAPSFRLGYASLIMLPM